MALAETARLLASYDFKNNAGSGINQAVGQLGKLEAATATSGKGFNVLQTGFSLVGKGAGAVGNAFNTLKSRIGGLLSGPLGLLGLGAGLFSVFGFIKSGIDQATEFGGVVSKLTALTGLSAEKVSRLAGAFEHFGLSADTVVRITGMAEKNLGILTKTTTTAGASTEQLTRAQEALRVAQLHLLEVEGKRNVSASTLVAAQNRVADAQRRLNELTSKGGVTTSGAAKFLKDYGFALTDASGKVKDFNQLILTAADYFNNPLIPAQTKAAALAKIFGRSWIELLPILKAGSKGITDAADEAQRLGLTLTSDNITALARLKTALRDFGTAMGGLKLQLGLAIVPLLTQLSTGFTHFLATADQFGVTGSQKIVGFFKDLISWGERAFGFIEHNIVPGIKAAIDNWNRLPAPLRSLLFKGFAANQTISFLLGFNPVSVGLSIAGAFAGKAAGILAGGLLSKLGDFFGGIFGKVAVQKGIPQLVAAVQPIPVFVTNPGFGLPGGGGPAGPVAEAEKAGGWVNFAKTILGLAGLGGLIYGGSQLLQGGANAGLNATGNPSFQDIINKGAQGKDSGFILFGNTQAVKENTAAIKANTTTVKPLGSGLSNAAHGFGRVAGTPGAAGLVQTQPLTAAQFESVLKTTPFIGPSAYKSIFEKFTTEQFKRRDPVGEQFYALVAQLKNPKAPAVEFEISGHLQELRNLEAYYIAHGDVKNALKVQGVIDKIDALIGATERNHPATIAAQKATEAAVVKNAAINDQGSRRVANILGTVRQATVAAQSSISAGAARTAAHLSRLEGLDSATATNTGISARKKSLISVTVPITTYASFSVNALGNQLTHIDETVSQQYGGKVVPI